MFVATAAILYSLILETMSKNHSSKLRKIFSIVTGIALVNKSKSKSFTKERREEEVEDEAEEESRRRHSRAYSGTGDEGECSDGDGDCKRRISGSEVHSGSSYGNGSKKDLAGGSGVDTRCDVVHCKHEVSFTPISSRDVSGLTEGKRKTRRRKTITSLDCGSVSSSHDAVREGLHRSQSFKFEQGPRCSDEVELTEDQKSELKQAFSMFEKTGKGRIQSRDLGELLRCLGWNPSEQDLEEARHELELSTRGTLSFAEVEAYIARRGGIYYGNNAEEDIMVAFQVLDKHGNGKITVSDFRHFMTTMGERMSSEEAEELIARSTQDGKDYIEYRDLVQAVQHLPT